MTKADSTTPEVDTAAKNKAVDKAKRDAAATLVKQNQDAFNQMVAEDLAGQGIEWSPRLTPEQRAAEQLATLIEQYPHLANQVNGASA